jgi:hypothetical protein
MNYDKEQIGRFEIVKISYVAKASVSIDCTSNTFRLPIRISERR